MLKRYHTVLHLGLLILFITILLSACADLQGDAEHNNGLTAENVPRAMRPCTPWALSPKDGAIIRLRRPELVVHYPSAPCPQADLFQFKVSLDAAGANIVCQSDLIPRGEFELTSWVVSTTLPVGSQLYWACRASEKGDFSQWTKPLRFTIATGETSVKAETVYADAVISCDTTCPLAVKYNDCNEAIGAPNFYSESNPDSVDGFNYYGFVSLGIRGSVILDLGETTGAVNGAGADLKIYQAVSREEFSVAVAQFAGGPYYDLGHAGTGWFNIDDPWFTAISGEYSYFNPASQCYTTGWIRDGVGAGEIGWCDIANTGFDYVRYVRVTDEQPYGDLRKDCYYLDELTGLPIPYLTAGADIDSVEAINMGS